MTILHKERLFHLTNVHTFAIRLGYGQFNGRCVGVNTYRNFSAVHGHLAAQIVILPVPVRENMYHRRVFYIQPLALIQIIVILRNARRIYDAEVRTLGRCIVILIPRCRLTDIIKARPDILSCNPSAITIRNPGISRGLAPANCQIVIRRQLMIYNILRTGILRRIGVISAALNGRRSLRTIHSPIRTQILIIVIVVFGVVEAYDVQLIGHLHRQRIAAIPAHTEFILAHGNRMLGINFLGPFDQILDRCQALLLRSFSNLIAQAPGNDTGRISVTANHLLQIELRPCGSLLNTGIAASSLKEAVVIVIFLTAIPSIKSFLDDRQTHLITNAHEFRRSRVMGDTNGVDTHFLHHLHLTFNRCGIADRTQCALIMMHAHTMQFHRLTVEFECRPFFFRLGCGQELRPAKTESGFVGILDLIVDQNLGLHFIKRRRIGRPQPRMIGSHGLRHIHLTVCRYGLCFARDRLTKRRTILVIEYGAAHLYIDRFLGLVFNRRADVDRNVSRLRLTGDIRCGNYRTVLCNVHRIGHSHVYIAINTAARIPATRLISDVAALGDICNLDCNDIFRFSITNYIVCNVKRERNIAIGIISDLLSIDPDVTIHIDTIKVNVDAFSLQFCWQHKTLSVPSCAARQMTDLRADLIGKVLFDAPVMRQIQRTPRTVIKTSCAQRGIIPAGIERKRPILVKIHTARRLRQ